MYYVICAAFIAMIGFYGAFQRLKRQPKRRKALTIACKWRCWWACWARRAAACPPTG